MYKNIDLKNKERYSGNIEIPREKLEAAAKRALARLEKNIEIFGDKLAGPIAGWNNDDPKGFSYGHYGKSDVVGWTSGMWTGMFWLGYMLTGDKKFKKTAESQLKHYIKVAKENINLNDHDTGFKFTPSCVAAYKLTGNKEAREAALLAAEIQFEHYCQHNKFIIRVGTRSEEDEYSWYRTLVDSMLNIPLFFWAYEETGDKKYYDAAYDHYHTTTKYLVREDGSSYHHYQFDPVTLKPVGGVTHQGISDESCWSRGQAWLVYGYPTAYKYTKDKELFDIHKAVSYFFIDNLPKDNVPYWDFDFTDGSFEPRDSSASAAAVCGLFEMCKHLPDDAEQKAIFKNAANIMLEALIDTCENTDDDKECMLLHVTHSKPHMLHIDDCDIYGDYFYLEALARALNPDIELFW